MSRTSKLRIVVLLLVYILVAVIVIPYVGRDLPYSVFYSSSLKRDHDRLLTENAIRVKHAHDVLSRSNCNGDCWNKANEVNTDPEFCFVIISVSRPAQTYFLTQVVAGLLPQIPPGKSVFTVYNAEGPTHLEAVRLSKMVPVYSNTTKTKIISPYAKELADYINALAWCRHKHARFSVIMEDDALPLTDFMERLQLILNHRISKTSSHWLFLKLYSPEKWQGWSNDKEIIAELILISILGGLLLVFIVYGVEILVSLHPVSRHEMAVRFVLSSLFVGFSVFCLGRQHWIALRQFSPHLTTVVPAPGCCTPATLFPSTHLNDLIQNLEATNCSAFYHLDIALDDIAKKKGLQAYLAIPNLVRHIGFVSSLGKGWKSPKEFQHIL